MTRVYQTAPPAAGAAEVRISAARNETEPFQVIATASPEALRAATIAISPLREPGGFEIAEIQVFYEHDIRVVEPSPKSPFPPMAHPDALIPVAPGEPIFQPVTHLPRANRVNQPFWIDVRVPKDAPPGEYTGEFALVADGERISIPVKLTVWDFALPDKPTLGSLFGLEAPRIAKLYDVELGTVPGNRILRAYEDLLADHRLAIDGLHGTLEVFDSKTERTSLTRSSQPILGTAEDVLHHFLDEKHLSTVVIPMWPEWPYPDSLGRDRDQAQRYVAEYVRLLQQRGWSGGVVGQCGYIDEPRSKADYERVREWGQFYNEVEERFGVQIPMFVTEQPAAEEEKWGSLEGYVDIWVTYVGDLWDDMHGPAKTRKVAARHAAGDEIWLYCGLTPMPESWLTAHGNPDVFHEGNPPAWLLDFPPINHRITTWIAPHYGATGFLYWATIDARDGIDPWQRADTFLLDAKYHYNGDGLLIYPGYRDQVGFNGPIASMRLKWIRESFEDHAYITLLKQRGEREFALSQIRRIARNVGDWDDNIPELFDAREAMAKRLSSPPLPDS